MSQRIQTSLLIFVLIAIYFIGLNDRGMFSDGYFYSTFGKHVVTMDRWLIPYFSKAIYVEFFDHTPFVFILEGLFFKIFGISNGSARLFILFFLIGTIFSVFNFLKKEKNINFAIIWLVLFLSIPPLLKKARFPNIDIPLMLWTSLALIESYRAIVLNKVNRWWSCGFFFGLALLSKGPLAGQIVLSIAVFLIWEKKFYLLKSWRPWAGLLLGFFIFALWPLSLYFSDRFDIFQRWFEFTILASVVQGRGESTSVFTYLAFLIKNASVWSVLALIGVFFILKKKVIADSIWKFGMSWLLTLLIPLSFASLKYSNYLIPGYPALALVACYPFLLMKKEKWEKAPKVLLMIFAPLLIILFFVLGKYKKLRDIPLYTALDYAREHQLPRKNWVLYNQCYDNIAAQGLMAFEESADVFRVENVKRLDRSALVIMRKSDLANLEDVKELVSLESNDLILACSGHACPN